VRDQDMTAWDRAHPAAEWNPRIAEWRQAHPDGTLEDLVRDLKLWRNPADKEAQQIAWYRLRDLGDPVACEGFQAMHAATATYKLRHPATPAVPGVGSR
jgi:hypothetical protein